MGWFSISKESKGVSIKKKGKEICCFFLFVERKKKKERMRMVDKLSFSFEAVGGGD